jgi:5,10-methylenetetrahydrofolate reductase
MPVLTLAQRQKIIENLPEVEYPKEVIERLNREYLVAKAQMASGELKAQTVAEIAAEYGIDLDEI